MSVHNKSKLSNADKLAYLKHALKDGPAIYVVEGLSGSGEYCEEAVDCLQGCFDQPHPLHQAQLRAIHDAPSLKDGNGKEE